MKKRICISVIFLIVLFVLPIAADTTATLTIVGYIGEPPGDVSLILTRSLIEEEPIDLTIDTVQKAVGTLQAVTNGPGYKVSIMSLNGYNLAHADTTEIPYTMHITGAVTWNSDTWMTPGEVIDFQHWETANTTYNLAVSVTSVDPATYPTGTYTDIITFNIRTE